MHVNVYRYITNNYEFVQSIIHHCINELKLGNRFNAFESDPLRFGLGAI